MSEAVEINSERISDNSRNSWIKKEHSITSDKAAFLLVPGAVAALHLAYTIPACSFLIAVYLWCLFELSALNSGRKAFYSGLAVGFLAGVVQLSFLWNIFNSAAIALWMVFAFWIALFVALAQACRSRFGPLPAALLIPFLWTGLEYFRSELYYLKFSWLNAGYAFADALPQMPLNHLGMYGVGFLLIAAVSLSSLLQLNQRIIISSGLLALLTVFTIGMKVMASRSSTHGNLKIAGVQMEFPSETEILLNLNRVIEQHPEAQLLVLSEYTLNGPVPDKIKDWCRQHQKYLIVGGEDPAGNSNYYNTVFVVSPSGDIVFRQAKCVPIQFFKDGLQAQEQKLWASPWGKIGICICYDLSYTRVTDQLVRQGAQALIVPTMDVSDWGRHQHELHACVAPIRAAEYGIPIFRLASSGISQCVNAAGYVRATAPFPGDGAILFDTMDLIRAGRLPWDRLLAPAAVGITGLTICWLVLDAFRRKNENGKSK